MEPGKQQNQTDSKLHFLDYWRIIRIRKPVIITVFFVVVLTTTIVTFLLPESYSSTVRIAIQKEPDLAPLTGVPTMDQHDPYFIYTEFEKIQSKSVLHTVITNLNLNERWAEEYGGGQILKTQESFQILQNLVDVNQSRNTSLIEITVFSKEPELAATIANEIAEVYRNNRLSVKELVSKEGIARMEEELAEQNKAIEAVQQELDRLKNELKISDAYVEGMMSATMEPETVRRMEMEKNRAESEAIQYESLLNELKSKTGLDQLKTISFATPGTQIPELTRDYYRTEQALAEKSPNLGPEHPEIQQLAGLKAKIESQLQREVDSVMQGLEAQVRASRERVAELEKAVKQAKEEEILAAQLNRPYFDAKRQLENMRRIRDAIQLRMIQEMVDSNMPKESIVQITDIAEPDTKPVKPKKPVNIALGVIVGLVLGIGMAFFIEYLDTSVKTIDDVEKSLQAPVLGVIPQNVGSLLEEGLDSPHAEAYRVLRTNILFSRKDKAASTITVVSGGAGEGKSTTIFNLATIFAQHDARCLIVDSDLRRPSLHKIQGVSNSIGLTDYLLGNKTFEEVVQTTPIKSLDFLPSGKLPSSSLGILNSSQMRDFIKAAKEKYDFVFFDSPPIMGVSDASILASEVDLSILVVQYRKYPQAMTLRAKQMVEKVGGTLAGVVLNNINISQDSYYYYYSGYYYDYYSKHDDDDDETGNRNNGGSKGSKSGDRKSVDLKKKY